MSCFFLYNNVTFYEIQPRFFNFFNYFEMIILLRNEQNRFSNKSPKKLSFLFGVVNRFLKMDDIQVCFFDGHVKCNFHQFYKLRLLDNQAESYFPNNYDYNKRESQQGYLQRLQAIITRKETLSANKNQ